MKSFKKFSAGVAALAIAIGASGCAQPDRWMVNAGYVEDFYVKYVMQKGAASAEGAQLMTWVVQICDINEADAKASDCVESTVIHNVSAQRVFNAQGAW